jgi:hypothetical protein
MTPDDFRKTCRRKEKICARLSRASFRLEMAELERLWAIMSAHREGMSVREIAKQVGLVPTRVHQLISNPQADLVEKALSVLREVGWPTLEDTAGKDEEQVADRLNEKAFLLVTCSKWLEELVEGQRPIVNLRPSEDWPDTNHTIVDYARVIRMLRRIAHDIDELARSRRIADMTSNTTDSDPCLRLRHKLCEPPITPPILRPNIQQSRRTWEEYEQSHIKAGLPIPYNPYRHINRSVK